MTNPNIPVIEPMGVRRGFGKISSYLKRFNPWGDMEKMCRDELGILQRYADEGCFSLQGMCGPVSYGHHQLTYMIGGGGNAVGIHGTMLGMAIVSALSGNPPGTDWRALWRRAMGYAVWNTRIWHAQVEAFHARPQDFALLLSPLGIEFYGILVGNCIALGWLEEAADLARRAKRLMDLRAFRDLGEEHRYRAQLFILRLVHDWRGWPAPQFPSQVLPLLQGLRSTPLDGAGRLGNYAYDDPLLEALLAHWRTPDPEDLKPLLLAACDRHTQETRAGDYRTHYDFGSSKHWYNPVEILSILRLREQLGLQNPELKHMLLNTPLGKLYEPVPFYTDALIEAVIRRAREGYPKLTERYEEAGKE